MRRPRLGLRHTPRANRSRPTFSIQRRWPTTLPRHDNRQRSSACARTTAQPPPSTWSMIGQAAMLAARCNARCWSCGVKRARSASGMHRSRSGVATALKRSAVAPSTAGTTWLRNNLAKSFGILRPSSYERRRPWPSTGLSGVGLGDFGAYALEGLASAVPAATRPRSIANSLTVVDSRPVSAHAASQMHRLGCMIASAWSLRMLSPPFRRGEGNERGFSDLEADPSGFLSNLAAMAHRHDVMASILRRLELTRPVLRAQLPRGRSATRFLHKTHAGSTREFQFARLANRRDLG